MKNKESYTLALAAAFKQAEADGIEQINRISMSPTSKGIIIHFVVKGKNNNLSDVEYEWKENVVEVVKLPYWMEK